MKVLVLNTGSSSIKYQFYDTDTKIALAKGMVERIGMSGAVLKHSRHDGDSVSVVGEILDHTIAIEYVLAVLMSINHGVIEDKEDIEAVGHRVVHGGEDFSGSVLITFQGSASARYLLPSLARFIASLRASRNLNVSMLTSTFCLIRVISFKTKSSFESVFPGSGTFPS